MMDAHEPTQQALPEGSSHEQASGLARSNLGHNDQRFHQLSSWTLPASIALSALIISFFTPWGLVVALGAVLWLGTLHHQYTLVQSSHARALSELAEHAAESELLSARLSTILNSVDVPILVTNNQGIIVKVNRSASTILGSGRALTNEHFDSLITQKPVVELEQLARTGESDHARLELPVGGDMRVFDVAADPIASTGGAVCTFTDITELFRSSTLKADFAANASHELRTPIASILGAIQTLDGPARHDHAMSDRLITMISSNATRLDLMVNDLLDLSKLESTSTPSVLVETSMMEIIDRSVAPFTSICERKGLKIHSNIDSASATLHTDESLLTLIIRNLIENATKFARDNTTITISAKPITMGVNPAHPPPAGLNGQRGIRISVQDEGIGIPIAHQQRIFERFYQVDEARAGSTARRGTGLGLAIVKHAARTLGGGIRLQSIPQQGTTMIVELPKCVYREQSGPNPSQTPN
ncbi:MAG: sensor histidine kinase [Phycisphaerales bacterium]